MKLDEVYFEDTNFIGREVESIQEVVKGMAANMDFANQDGAGFLYDIEEEDECTYREPTEQEVFGRIQECLANEEKVYVGLFLDMSKHTVVPAKSTNLQSDFAIGQEVYIIQDNKIIKGKIDTIQIVQSFKNNVVVRDARYKIAWTTNNYKQNSFVLGEEEIFATKDALVEHISNTVVE